MEMLVEEQERAVNEYYDTDISFEELPFTGGDTGKRTCRGS